jgi:hypothetical protein
MAGTPIGVWTRVTSEGRTVYWNKPLPNGQRLTVSRYPERWTWKIHSANEVVASGTASSVTNGRRFVEQASLKFEAGDA